MSEGEGCRSAGWDEGCRSAGWGEGCGSERWMVWDVGARGGWYRLKVRGIGVWGGGEGV